MPRKGHYDDFVLEPHASTYRITKHARRRAAERHLNPAALHRGNVNTIRGSDGRAIVTAYHKRPPPQETDVVNIPPGCSLKKVFREYWSHVKCISKETAVRIWVNRRTKQFELRGTHNGIVAARERLLKQVRQWVLANQ